MGFMNRLKMLVRGTSLGDVHTLIAYPVMASHRDVSPKQRQKMGIRDNLLRMSLGIEAVEDIIEDLEQALAR
jgi:cystathionine gamma-synthase/methionine-gamma-lyase